MFGGAAAEGVIGVAPGDAVRGGDVGEVVLGVPGVVPGVGLLGETGLLAERGAPGGVVLVADAARGIDAGAGVGAGAGGFGVGKRFGPGGLGLVARMVVGVGLLPGAGLDVGDAAYCVEGVLGVVGGSETAVGAPGVGVVQERG